MLVSLLVVCLGALLAALGSHWYRAAHRDATKKTKLLLWTRLAKALEVLRKENWFTNNDLKEGDEVKAGFCTSAGALTFWWVYAHGLLVAVDSGIRIRVYVPKDRTVPVQISQACIFSSGPPGFLLVGRPGAELLPGPWVNAFPEFVEQIEEFAGRSARVRSLEAEADLQKIRDAWMQKKEE